MCNKISAWQVIRSNFTSNIVLYRLTLIILDTRTFNSRGPSYIESTSSQHALVLTPLTSNESSIYAPECAEWKRFVLLGCSRNLVKKMETSWQVVSRLPSQTNEGEFPPFLKGTPSSSKKCQTEGHMLVSLVGGFFDPPGPTPFSNLLGPHVLILRGLGTHVPRSWFIYYTSDQYIVSYDMTTDAMGPPNMGISLICRYLSCKMYWNCQTPKMWNLVFSGHMSAFVFFHVVKRPL